MYFPFITKRDERKRVIYKRKGGGGGGKGGGGSGGSGGKAPSGSGGGGAGGGGGGGRPPSSINTPAGSKSSSPYGNGGGSPITIPQGQPFAGRQAGGGTRDQVYGNSKFGSGYPGGLGAGSVIGRSFPFYYWPLAFGGVGAIGAAGYLHDHEYGNASNTSRPGGPMMTAFFVSNVTGSTYRVIADNETTVDLISDLRANCSSNLNSDNSSSSPSPYNDTSPLPPQPEQVVQYYRASSVALSLDAYNNTAATLDPNGSVPNAPLPSGIDTTLLDCLNQTIGAAVPLVGAGKSLAFTGSPTGVLFLISVLWLSVYCV